MLLSQVRKMIFVLAATLGLTGSLAVNQAALAETVKTEHGQIARSLNLPIYEWQDYLQTPKAVVIAIHGLTMHGTVFDACAQKLAADGAIVIAPDLRGYGAWYQAGKKADKNAEIDYEQSEKDVLALANAVHEQYKGLPVFVAGESLGGAMAIRLAAKRSDLIDGLILCSPAIKMYHPAKTVVDAALSLANHNHEFDCSDYIKDNFSEDGAITQEGMTDPLIRKQLSMGDLLESCRFISATRHFIGKIPSAMPILVLQGEEDRIVKPSGAIFLESNLKTTDTTVKLLPRRGHILIETQHVHAADINAIISWVDTERQRFNLNHAQLAIGNLAPDAGGSN